MGVGVEEAAAGVVVVPLLVPLLVAVVVVVALAMLATSEIDELAFELELVTPPSLLELPFPVAQL